MKKHLQQLILKQQTTNVGAFVRLVWFVIKMAIIKEKLSILVQSANNFYWERFINIHHITPEMTRNASTFDKIWHFVEPFIKNQSVVALNGFSLDFPLLAQTLQYYSLEVPKYEKHCIYRLFRNNLASLCKEYKIHLNHHHALSDARICRELFLLIY